MIYYRQNRQAVQLGNELAHGGEGAVYEVSDKTVAKIFFEPKPRYEKIKRFISKGISNPHICTPTELLFDENNQFVGYIMPKAAGHDLATSIFQPQLFKQKFEKWSRQ